MKNIKKAFTLAEVLISMAIIGTVALLVIPGLIKDVNNKSRMSLLNSVVTSVNNHIAQEISSKNAKSMELTKIIIHTQEFLDEMDHLDNQQPFSPSLYSNYNGGNTTNFQAPNHEVLLKNGAAVGINHHNENKRSDVIIDINGKQDPNIAGVDLFILELAWENDYTKGIHMGDLGGFKTDKTETELKTDCKSGDAKACYKAAELSGFDPNYLEN